MSSTLQDIEVENTISLPVSDVSNVVFAEFNTGTSYPMPEGSVHIDEFVKDAEEQGFSAELEEARKIFADKIYKNKSITSIRMSKGWSQRYLAEKLCTSQSHVSKIESGREDLRLSTIKKLAAVFDMEYQEIITALSEK